MSEENQGKISYADYSVIDEYLKLKRDSDEIFRQHKDQLTRQQEKIESLNDELAKKNGIIEQIQQQLVRLKQEFDEMKNEKDRLIQQQQMQIQNLNSRLAGFQRKG